MRNVGPPIAFRPNQGGIQPPPAPHNQGFNRNQFSNQFQPFQNFQVNTGHHMIPGPQTQHQQVQPAQSNKSYMNDPRAGSNMDAKYVAHLKTLHQFIGKNDMKDFPGATLVNKTEDKMHFELCLELNYVIKSQSSEIPIKLRISPKFPNEAPKLFATVTIKHPVINSNTLEIDYTKYYNWSKNGTIKNIILETVKYFQAHPVENQVIDKKMRELLKGIDHQDFQKLKLANVKEFYQHITPSEQNDFKVGGKRLELLKKMPEFKALTDKHEKLIRVAAQLKPKVEERYKTYENNSFELLHELDDFENMKQQVFSKYNACLLLQERFTKPQLLPVIEEQIKAKTQLCNPK